MTSLVSSRPRGRQFQDGGRAAQRSDDLPAGASRGGRWYDIRTRLAYRRGIGQTLREGPLFRPESDRATIRPALLRHPALLRNGANGNAGRQPGWIFVCTDRKFPATVRLGIAEADDTELRSIRANRKVSRDLRLRDGEVLRYSVFANDVHAARRSVEAFLLEFTDADDRYRVHSAAAATAIETCGVQLHSRRSNFEPIDAVGDNAQAGGADVAAAATGASEFVTAAGSAAGSQPRERVPPGGRRESRRGLQRQQLASVVSEVGHSIALASEALQDTAGVRRRLTAGLGLENPHRGLLRPDRADDRDAENVSATTRLSAGDIVNMERWVMRREAIEYIKSKRVQLAQLTLAALVCGAGLGFGLYKFSAPLAQTVHLGLAVVAIALLCALLTMATFWLRFRKGLVVWRGILANCADATLPGLGGKHV